MQGPTLVVMAAGIGSRYGGLKQIDPIGPAGEVILDYSVHDALAAGFEKAVFIIRRDIEDAFREKLGRTFESRIETAYVFQELDKLPTGFRSPEGRTKPWGTGHAVLCSRAAVDGPFAVINADDFYGADSFRALATHLKTARDGNVYDYSMVGFQLANTVSEHGHVSRGVCEVDAKGFLKGIQERTHIERREGAIQYTDDEKKTWKSLPEDMRVSMNTWGFTPSLFDELESRFTPFLAKNRGNLRAEFFLPSAIADLLALKKATVKVLPTEARWVGVTYKEDLPSVKQAIRHMVAGGVYPDPLWG